MLNKLLVAFSFIFLVSSCKTIDTQNRFEEEQPAEIVEEIVPEQQPQQEQTFEVVENEVVAEAANEKTQEEIEEVEVPDRVLFGYDKSDIDAKAKKVLDIQSEWLKSDTTIKITIEGHCDERGTREYNIALGERRALSAKNYLVSKGIDEKRIKTISYGKERPAFIGSNEESWAKNRRAVTITAE